MEPAAYLEAVRKRWLIVVILALFGGAVGFAFSAQQPTLYHATSSVFVSAQGVKTTTEVLQGSSFTHQQVQSYAALATLPIVLRPVIDALGLDTTPQRLAGSVTANIRLNTVIIDISVSDTSAARSAAIANSVVSSLSNIASKLSPQGKISAISMSVVAPARTPTSPFSPNTNLIVLGGLLIGLFIGVAVALLREVLDKRVRTSRDIESASDALMLGTVARNPDNDDVPVMISAPDGAAAENFRRLATGIEYTESKSGIQVVMVTSASAGEGKTSVALNLGIALSERRPRVLIIDAHLRSPSIASVTGLDAGLGLTSVLSGAVSSRSATQSWFGDRVDVITAGTAFPNSSYTLASKGILDLVKWARAEYDFVVIDAPPVLVAADALTLATLADGVIFVARYNSTNRMHLGEAIRALDAVSAPVLGVVLNGVRGTAIPKARVSPPDAAAQMETVKEADSADQIDADNNEDSPSVDVSKANSVDADKT